MDEITLKSHMRSKGWTILDGPLEHRVDVCLGAVKCCIPPRSVSDRTCMQRLGRWLLGKCERDAEHTGDLLSRVIDGALEASSPGARNPAAVFMSILKKELNYPH